MKRKRFVTIEEIKEKSKMELLAIPKSVISRIGRNAGGVIGYFESDKFINKKIRFQKILNLITPRI